MDIKIETMNNLEHIKKGVKMSFMELAKNRYSVRKFTSEEVPQDLLDKVLEAGMVAPTAKNLQPQRIYVIRSQEGLAKIDALTPCRYGAPVMFLFAYNADEEWKNPKQPGIVSGQQDVSIVATHMMFEAKDIGLDTLWIDFFPNAEAEKVFDLPKNEKAVLLMALGYASPEAKPSESHTKKRPMSDLVRYL